MDSTRQIKLSYKEDFEIACTINNLNYTDLLQYFIDHVSFYVFIGGNMKAAYIWATKVCIECGDAIGGQATAVTDKSIQQISLKYIKMLTLLIERDEAESLNKSTYLMQAWSDEMRSLTSYIKTIQLPNKDELYLSFDFNLLCSINGLSIQQQLQYFIDRLSLARVRANNLLEGTTADPAASVLFALISSDSRLKTKLLPRQDIYRKYGLQLLELDKKLRGENNLKTRILNYRAFYQDWYQALNKAH